MKTLWIAKRKINQGMRWRRWYELGFGILTEVVNCSTSAATGNVPNNLIEDAIYREITVRVVDKELS